MHGRFRISVPAAAAIGFAGVVAAPCSGQTAQTPADSVMLYRTRVQPILEARCLKCHGSDLEKLKSGLSLASRTGLLQGGARGPAIDTSTPQRSNLLIAIGYEDDQLQMPPDGRLTDDQLEVLREWVLQGAPYGGDDDGVGAVASTRQFEITEEDRAWWSVQPPIGAH